MVFTKKTAKTVVIIIILAIIGEALPPFVLFALIGAAGLVVAIIADALSLYGNGKFVELERVCNNRFSIGDNEKVTVKLRSLYNRNLHIEIIDEVPIEFQNRDFSLLTELKQKEEKSLNYELRATSRGEFEFCILHAYASTDLGLIQRHFCNKQSTIIEVYPSVSFLKEAQFLSIENKNRLAGEKKIQRLGQNKEFEHIREYGLGDDYRTINWKATAKRNKLMVNQYTESQSQNVYLVIDKGRGMQHCFNGMSQLDYAINATLQLSHVAIHNNDNVGIITIDKSIDSYLIASKDHVQQKRILNLLYNEKTTNSQGRFSDLYSFAETKIKRRCLMVIFTTFNGMDYLNMQLEYMKKIAERHRLLVVFFDDLDLKEMARQEAWTSTEYIQKSLAKHAIYEKKMIAKELRRHGISALLTSPQHLSADTINKYLEIKESLEI